MKTIALVSHDSGGAEILSSWLVDHTGPAICVLDGPAKKIFKRKCGIFEEGSLEGAIEQADWVLCGTSWQSNLERRAIAQARVTGKYSVAFLDHWANFRSRFEENGTFVFPDEIWVGDPDALIIAKKYIPEVRISLVENPYFKQIVFQANTRKKDLPEPLNGSVLYVTEPTSEHALKQFGDARYFGFTEQEALYFFLTTCESKGIHLQNLLLRPHPAESNDKYLAILKPIKTNWKICSSTELIDHILQSEIVAGCNTTAMVVALLLGKRVLCTIPPGGPSCSLPQSQIEYLRDLVLAG